MAMEEKPPLMGKEALSQKIAEQVDEFLKAGGEVKQAGNESARYTPKAKAFSIGKPKE